MTTVPHRRTIWVINRSVQLKVIAYVMASVVAGVVFTAFVHRLTGDAVAANGYVPGRVLATLAGSGLMLFALIVALGMYLTNQIAGPLFRLQRELAKIADGSAPDLLHPRRGDSYQDLVAEYNRAVQTLGLVKSRDQR